MGVDDGAHLLAKAVEGTMQAPLGRRDPTWKRPGERRTDFCPVLAYARVWRSG
jgi:hypothetical protein